MTKWFGSERTEENTICVKVGERAFSVMTTVILTACFGEILNDVVCCFWRENNPFSYMFERVGGEERTGEESCFPVYFGANCLSWNSRRVGFSPFDVVRKVFVCGRGCQRNSVHV